MGNVQGAFEGKHLTLLEYRLLCQIKVNSMFLLPRATEAARGFGKPATGEGKLSVAGHSRLLAVILSETRDIWPRERKDFLAMTKD